MMQLKKIKSWDTSHRIVGQQHRDRTAQPDSLRLRYRRQYNGRRTMKLFFLPPFSCILPYSGANPFAAWGMLTRDFNGK
ncbi:hypothetical protein MUG84_03875 [Paenibacillus sp. KQZ6P-2]|uniref:Uncharacterized protein n=1 Tax=Paenibacillus mangrovi TaxID=2931978 RepID=A0A9X1WKZ6_9BACL|nr:hypothetical protein [Paenibacillus mangrovi]MCJ8010883.1 hypothetical protein [Paenibacillus mangrovi]